MGESAEREEEVGGTEREKRQDDTFGGRKAKKRGEDGRRELWQAPREPEYLPTGQCKHKVPPARGSRAYQDRRRAE